MKIIRQNILDVNKGVIVHQVNCMDRIGGGLSGAIIRKYPEVEKQYHAVFAHTSPKAVFRTWTPVQVSDSLTVVNCFTQFGYGNPKRTGKKYTDENALVKALGDICRTYPAQDIWIPYGIGCGLGGADWNELVPRINYLPLFVAKL